MEVSDNPARWWAGQPAEIFWLEITDREDLGVDLNAPAEREGGTDYWKCTRSCSCPRGRCRPALSDPPKERAHALVTCRGPALPGRGALGAHGQAGGRGPVAPYLRPGWRHPLDGPYELAEPVMAQQLQDIESDLQSVDQQLQAQHPGQPIYFPFQLSERRPVRAFQGYLTKFPHAVVALLPQLAEVDRVASRTPRTSARPAPTTTRGRQGVGSEYRPAHPRARTAQREPFSVDPEIPSGSSSRGARRTQYSGRPPRRARRGSSRVLHYRMDPPRSTLLGKSTRGLLLRRSRSLTDTNEERQLRLALGQVLRYGDLLATGGRPVRRIIAVERKPADDSWIRLCKACGVELVWPDSFETLFAMRR